MGAREQVPMDGLQCRRSSPNIWAAGGALSFLSKVMYGGCQKYDVASLSPCSAFTGIPLSSIICGGLRPSPGCKWSPRVDYSARQPSRHVR